MSVVCSSCGQEIPDGFRFCGACGAAFEEPRTDREERKVVTVLFCDLVGSTARAERLDPEDVRALLSGYHERVKTELERFGGTVEKFIGDAVMALFGAPVAHEDDPERAVRAALAVREALEGELATRIGITTGEALIALGARPDRGEGMAAGDVVNTAARLQAAAPENGIVVDATTYRATERAIEYEEQPALAAKGKAAPMPLWEVVQARSRFGVDVHQAGASPLVGRERERALLTDALARVQAERAPQLVTLVGVPGIGKSRLVWELFRHIDTGSSGLVGWRQGRSLPYGEGVAFWALGEIVKAQAGILETDGEAETTAKLERAVRTLVPDERDAAWVRRHLRPLVGLEAAGAGGARDEAFAAWRRFLEALAEQRPLVLVFEDLHFADDGLLDFVDHVVDWASGVPLLVLGTARPELLARRPAWGGGKANAVTISLSPLSHEETAQLVHALLERSALDADLRETLLDRAGGNPLYAEEFARLLAAGREPGEVPETVQGIVAARLDLLPAEEKRLLQDASVVGKVFWLGALASMDPGKRRSLEQRLHALERQEFVRRERASSVAGETEYAFRHVLVRDVAYGQIPRRERSEKHRRAAGWIGKLGRPEDHAELLAHHYRSALELAGAAGEETAELGTSARLALRAAGDRAFAVNAYAAAAGYYDAAIGLWPGGDRERAQLLLRWARALDLAGADGAADALEQAGEALLAAGDREAAAEAETFLSRVWWHRGRRDEAFRHLARSEELAGSAPSAATARVLASAARMRGLAGDVEEGQRLATEALALAETLALDEIRMHALTTIGSNKDFLGDPSGARDLERAFELAVAANSPQVGTIANNLAVASFLALDFRRMGAYFDEGRALAERLGDATGARWLRGQQTNAAYWLGRWDEALRRADEFIAECEAGSPHYLEAPNRRTRGRIRSARGDTERALADFRRALALAREAKDPQALLPALDDCAVALETHGRDDEAREVISDAVELARDNPHAGAWGMGLGIVSLRAASGFERELREILARVPSGRWQDVCLACLDRDFAGAAEMWAAGGNVSSEARLRLRAAEELAGAGRHAEASEQLDRALAFYRSVGATFFIREGEALLAKTA